jgi:hypothetical protein
MWGFIWGDFGRGNWKDRCTGETSVYEVCGDMLEYPVGISRYRNGRAAWRPARDNTVA